MQAGPVWPWGLQQQVFNSLEITHCKSQAIKWHCAAPIPFLLLPCFLLFILSGQEARSLVTLLLTGHCAWACLPHTLLYHPFLPQLLCPHQGLNQRGRGQVPLFFPHALSIRDTSSTRSQRSAPQGSIDQPLLSWDRTLYGPWGFSPIHEKLTKPY